MIISNFKIVRPEFIRSQASLLKWISLLQLKFAQFDNSLNFEKIKQGALAIDSRGTIVEDCLYDDFDQMKIFHPEHGLTTPTTKAVGFLIH